MLGAGGAALKRDRSGRTAYHLNDRGRSAPLPKYRKQPHAKQSGGRFLARPPRPQGIGSTDPDQLEEWFSADGEERDLVIETVETRRRVAYTWEEGRVAIEVEEVDTGTRVVVTESGEPGWNAVFALRSLAYARA